MKNKIIWEGKEFELVKINSHIWRTYENCENYEDIAYNFIITENQDKIVSEGPSIRIKGEYYMPKFVKNVENE